MWTSLKRWLYPKNRTIVNRRSALASRLTLEQLEDRTMPSTVSVLATTPNATEGGAQGVFTISRSDTSGMLTVNYQMSGTATNGTDYSSLTGTVPLPEMPVTFKL